MEDMANSSYPSLAEFYAGKTVALTGGTGFLGQGIIEKLLWGCPDIEKIIILIRTKRGVSPDERLQQLAQKPVFDRLREINSDFTRKLTCVSCDLESPDLGLTRKGRRILRNETNVFIHCAATLKFNEIIRIAFEMNVQCTRRIMKLCREMPNIDAFVHISTAFVNSDRYEGTIEEKVYPCKINYKDMEKSLKWMSDEAVEKIVDEILGDRPNSYTVTKAMAEDAIEMERGWQLPVCIVRPGMITPALNQPQPGWIGNVYGPTAFVAANLMGINKTAACDRNINADLVPVDFVVDGALAAAMKTAVDMRRLRHGDDVTSRQLAPRPSIVGSEGYESNDDSNYNDELSTSDSSDEMMSVDLKCFKKEKEEEKPQLPVYHITTCAVNPMKIGIIIDGLNKWNSVYPADLLLPTHAEETRNRFMYDLKSFLVEYLPAVWLDCLATLVGQRRKAVLVYSKLKAGMDVMEFFFNYCFDYQWKQSRILHQSLTVKDQKTYNFDPSTFDWMDYMGIYCRGVRKFILREKTNDAQNRYKKHRMKQFYGAMGRVAQLGSGFVFSSLGVTTSIWNSQPQCYV